MHKFKENEWKKLRGFQSNNKIKIIFESNYATVVVQIHVHQYSNKTKNTQNQNDCISEWKIIYGVIQNDCWGFNNLS